MGISTSMAKYLSHGKVYITSSALNPGLICVGNCQLDLRMPTCVSDSGKITAA